VLETEKELFIKIKADKTNKILIIIDSSIGMTKADLVNNLNMLARFGMKNLMETLQAGAEMGLNGESMFRAKSSNTSQGPLAYFFICLKGDIKNIIKSCSPRNAIHRTNII
jgi:hypothetical protein